MMKSTSWSGRAIRLGITLALVAAPAWAFAQEGTADSGEPEFEGLGRIFAELQGWVTQPVGADLTLALRQNPNTDLGTDLVTVPTGTDARLRYRVGYELRDNLGTFVVTWYATKTEDRRDLFTPSEFGFGQVNTYPLFAGAYDDGLTDGIRSDANLTTRDIRVSYYRDLPGNRRIDARWFVGYRRVAHNRDTETLYYALVPNLPPILDPVSPPRTDLDPSADRGASRSEVNVRGIEAGFETEMPIWRDRVRLEAGISAAVLRGRLSTNYESTTHFYAYRGGVGGLPVYVDPNDPSAFEDPDIVPQIRQEDVRLGIRSNNESTDASILEGFLGVRWLAWRTLEVVGGFRSTYYDNIAEELVPSSVEFDDDLTSFNISGFERRSRSLTLEGYYLGVSYRY